ncbi:hypothetical protein [Terricaulis sp.]|uniref:hypothetical protein n=1 Tax=Terricaulis sp. TaxID=2768686 RepID=UPI002AC68418|nr:hypothetical protein [Terricaulis sp.]MDZ4690843.1 hypothetical protein [Terricaulis sp.]
MIPTTSTRRAALLGAAAAMTAGAASAQSLSDLIQRVNPQSPQTNTARPPITAGRQELTPLGYALGFQPIRSLLSSGDYMSAIATYRDGPPASALAPAAAAAEDDPAAANAAPRTLFSSSDVFLCNSELGLMNFDATSFPDSTTHFSTAHDAVSTDQENESGTRLQRLRRFGNRIIRRGAAFVTGRDEIAVYTQRDYERILQLNYLALNYLVAGDRRAYNVNRLAIEEQDLARRNFEEEIGRAQERLGQAREDSTNGAKAASVTDTFAAEFTSYQPISGRVPSAYVNPLGFYLSGAIQEITSVERPALRGNARASYQAALELAGTSPQLAAAIQAMQAPPAPGERILHIIIGEGFAPSRQALLYGVQLDQQIIPVRIPIYAPNGSSITRLQLAPARGAPIARLDAVGDVEAMVMRSQQDRMPQMLLGVIASAWRASTEQRFAADMGEFASSVMQFKQSFDSPDMRSWSTLPSKFHIARVRLPANQTRFRLDALSGTRVAHTRTIDVPADLQHCVAYGRVMDGVLTVEQPRRLWIDGGIEETAP